ncbi:MAG: hypothetical protein AAGU05_01825, partial [Anaerolineaceae bacterium]
LPACKNCIKAYMQNLPFGVRENFALRPVCNICIQGVRRANFALQMDAKLARHVSAKSARDSY